MKDHPIHRMLTAGLKCCINSDDPAYFGGYMADNFGALHSAVTLTHAQVLTLALNSVDACFAPDEWKAEVRAKVLAYAAEHGVSAE